MQFLGKLHRPIMCRLTCSGSVRGAPFRFLATAAGPAPVRVKRTKVVHLLRATLQKEQQQQQHASTSPSAAAASSRSPSVGDEVKVQGWVRTLRSQKSLSFIDVNDGSSLAGIQAVVDVGAGGILAEVAGMLAVGCSVEVTGVLAASMGKGQAVEVQASSLRILGGCDPSSYPLQRKHKASLESLRGMAHLRPRTNTAAAVARVRSVAAFATHQHFQGEGFVYVHTPLITAADCEGAGEMFRVTTLPIAEPGRIKTLSVPKQQQQQQQPKDEADAPGSSSATSVVRSTDFRKDFFQKPSYLTVSGQLCAEAFACALSDVYTFGPTFRAEKSDTPRHLAEFYMVEPEMAFTALHGAMDGAEEYVKAVISAVLERCQEDLEFFEKHYEKGLLQRLGKYAHSHTSGQGAAFERIPYTTAVSLLQAEIAKDPSRWQFPSLKLGDDLSTEHERWLAGEAFGEPCCVFVYNYPRAIKSFYMRDNAAEGVEEQDYDEDEGAGAGHDGGGDTAALRTVRSFDLLVPRLGELVGGSQREERVDVLEKKISEFGLSPEDYKWYLDLRRFGSVPHSGYGVGFERLVCFLTGMENVRDVIPFPRYLGKADY